MGFSHALIERLLCIRFRDFIFFISPFEERKGDSFPFSLSLSLQPLKISTISKSFLNLSDRRIAVRDRSLLYYISCNYSTIWNQMAVSRSSFGFVAAVALLFAIFLPVAQPQSFAPAPAPAPTSDGTFIDQGIAYILMLVALALTYLIHDADLSHSF